MFNMFTKIVSNILITVFYSQNLTTFFSSLTQVNTPKEVMHEWQQRPQALVSRLIRKHLALDNTLKKPLIANSSICSPRRFKLVQQESEAHE